MISFLANECTFITNKLDKGIYDGASSCLSLDLETKLELASIAYDYDKLHKHPIEALAFPRFREEVKSRFR